MAAKARKKRRTGKKPKVKQIKVKKERLHPERGSYKLPKKLLWVNDALKKEIALKGKKSENDLIVNILADALKHHEPKKQL